MSPHSRVSYDPYGAALSLSAEGFNPFQLLLYRLPVWTCTPRKIQVHESVARNLHPGSYIDHGGRIFKVVRKQDRGWFSDSYDVFIRGAHESAPQIQWLEDQR